MDDGIRWPPGAFDSPAGFFTMHPHHHLFPALPLTRAVFFFQEVA